MKLEATLRDSVAGDKTTSQFIGRDEKGKLDLWRSFFQYIFVDSKGRRAEREFWPPS